MALAFLHSWNYMSLPPNSFSLAASFEALAATRGLLRPPLPATSTSIFSGPPDPVQDRVVSRITDGYSMVNQRVITGETTAAFVRGPFTPTKVQYPQWDLLSNSGYSLQILDQQLGLMDITYSAAWQLGRTLAMANQPYSTAISRVRKAITDPALYKSQQQALEKAGLNFKDREPLIASFRSTAKFLFDMSRQMHHDSSAVNVTRWSVPRQTISTLSYHSQDLSEFLEDNLVEQAKKVASSPDGKDPDQPYGPPYDEYNTPYSADWVVVLRFVLDLMYLVNIPAHYLITDPSHLPIESFRMFYIDPNWIDALVDGGLSIGNHIDPTDDKVRRAIKQAINRYFATPNSTLKYPPPVPKYGFYMRSAVVTKFPDLVVSTNPIADTAGTPLLGRHEIIDTNLMFGLLNHEPIANETFSLTFTQPAHQQTFTAAKTLSNDQIQTSYSRIYTVSNPADPDRNKPIEERTWKRGETSDRGVVCIWGTNQTSDDIRTLHVENMASDLFNILQTELDKIDKDYFTEKIQTAAMMGIQLNDPCWQLQFEAPTTDCPPGAVAMQLTYREAPQAAIMASQAVKRVQPTCSRIPTFEERARGPKFKPKSNPPYYGAVLDSSLLIPNDGNHNDFGDKGHSSASSVVVVTPTASTASSPELLPIDSLSEDWNFTKLHRSLSYDSVDETGGGGGGASPPEFDWKVIPASNPSTSKIFMLDYPQDLIISIVYKDNAANYKLTRLVVNVPVGKPVDSPTLASVYRGPGCVMLSNLQFNVRTTYSNDEKMLKLILIPRTTLGYVPVARIKELSFLLRGVETYRYTDGLKSVLLTGQPEYLKVAPVEKALFRATLYPYSKPEAPE